MSDFEAYRNFVVNSLKLMVVVREASGIPGGSSGSRFRKHLDMRVDILRHTALYDGRHPASVLDPPNADWGEAQESVRGEDL